MPFEFRDTAHIKEALLSGRYCVDWWEGDPREGKSGLGRAYFVRPVGKGKEGILRDPTWGGIGCTFLADTGCSLEPDSRPAGCRQLEPMKGNSCISHGAGKREAAIAWIKWDIGKLLEELEL